MLTEEQLREIEAVERAATTGPWMLSGHELYYGKDCFSFHQQIYYQPNAAFIAGARTWVPQLLAMVRELQQLIAGFQRDRGHAWMEIEDLRKKASHG